MSVPKFGVGENVIICSEHFPQCNGDAIITEIKEGYGHHVVTGEFYYGYCYRTDTTGNKGLWAEYSLRKKHKPGDSFDSLINSLKQPSEQHEDLALA